MSLIATDWKIDGAIPDIRNADYDFIAAIEGEFSDGTSQKPSLPKDDTHNYFKHQSSR
ncbi:MAG: hypothetical protein Q7J09_11070 [Methanocalculus sp.]|uniref:hypothetical protein n=1 Tax=Methanocalculus sp. TaxID=2004547 RepID=UPI0027222235|nr:hypothetical protein [Methanocalculus sp.]MDO9540523.1 hypothetical protein [Methanocalculus sp.]